MEEFAPNSHKSKEEAIPEKKLQKVVTGEAKTTKKNGVQKFADVFVAEDVSKVKSYILLDVLIPAIKKAIDDVVSNGIHMLLYNGETVSRKSGVNASRVSYRDCYRSDDGRRDTSIRASNDFDFENLEFETRGDAEAVLDAMDDALARFKVVSVGDLYDLANVSTTNYTVNRYGWTNLRSAESVRLRNGRYMLKLPRPMLIV